MAANWGRYGLSTLIMVAPPGPAVPQSPVNNKGPEDLARIYPGISDHHVSLWRAAARSVRARLRSSQVLCNAHILKSHPPATVFFLAVLLARSDLDLALPLEHRARWANRTKRTHQVSLCRGQLRWRLASSPTLRVTGSRGDSARAGPR